MEKIDFLAIGDIVTDAFIKLKDAHVNCRVDTGACELCMRFGDKIPYESVDVVKAVGNSPNAAVSASRLGLKTALLTYTGDDQDGAECIKTLKNENINTDFIVKEAGKKTNYHYVLWYEVERTILIKHSEFNYSFPQNLPPVGWIYLSSLAPNSLDYHAEIVEFLKTHPETKLAFQPGTFQISLGKEKLKDLYAHTEVFFCNLEEAQRILEVETREIKELAQGLHNLGPKIVAISDGPKGAYASDGENLYYVPMYPDMASPVDRTGAGDSFSSTFTSALALGKSVEEALLWGPVNSMSVVHYVGAQKGLLSREKLEEYLKNSPTNYFVEKK